MVSKLLSNSLWEFNMGLGMSCDNVQVVSWVNTIPGNHTIFIFRHDSLNSLPPTIQSMTIGYVSLSVTRGVPIPQCIAT